MRILGVLFGFIVFAAGCAPVNSDDLVVYSARSEELVKPVFDAYTQETGVPVRFVTDKAGALIERLKVEGQSGRADVLITVDAGNLWHAKNEGLLQPFVSEVLTTSIEKRLRDDADQWFGLSVRARTIVYHPQRVDASELSTYEALGDVNWKGRLCLRTSKKVYNQSLVAMLIDTHGEAKTETIVKSWIANLAAPVFASDNEVLDAIAAGQCDVGIVNTYYLARKIVADNNFPVKLFWANQDSGGVHVNVSGAGLLKNAKNVSAAKSFIEWLASESAQKLFASSTLEYPVLDSVDLHPVVGSWGGFVSSDFPLSRAGQLQKKAVALMDRVGYN